MRISAWSSDVCSSDLGVLFSRDIPALIRERMGPVVDGFLARHGLARADLDGYACHPGGAKVIAALEEVFGVPDGGFPAARGVLRDFCNMSAEIGRASCRERVCQSE